MLLSGRKQRALVSMRDVTIEAKTHLEVCFDMLLHGFKTLGNVVGHRCPGNGLRSCVEALCIRLEVLGLGGAKGQAVTD